MSWRSVFYTRLHIVKGYGLDTWCVCYYINTLRLNCYKLTRLAIIFNWYTSLKHFDKKRNVAYPFPHTYALRWILKTFWQKEKLPFPTYLRKHCDKRRNYPFPHTYALRWILKTLWQKEKLPFPTYLRFEMNFENILTKGEITYNDNV